MLTVRVNWSDPDDVGFESLDMGPKKVILVKETHQFIVVKVPGHTGWSRIGERSYAKTRFMVFGKTSSVEDGAKMGMLERVLDFPAQGRD